MEKQEAFQVRKHLPRETGVLNTTGKSNNFYMLVNFRPFSQKFEATSYSLDLKQWASFKNFTCAPHTGPQTGFHIFGGTI